MTDLDLTLCSALNTYCFQNIWNEPVSEYRANVRPYMLNARSQTGRFNSMDHMVELPDPKRPFYIYAVAPGSVVGMRSLDIPKNQWIATDVLCNDYNVLCHTYHVSGKMFQKGSVYLYWNDDCSALYIAIAKAMSLRVVPYTEMPNIYLTLYYDSDIVNNVTVYSYKLPLTDNDYLLRGNIQMQYNSCRTQDPHTSVYVDGYLIEVTDIRSFPLLSYIDIVCDENNVLGFSVDLTDSSNNVGFYSDMDKLDKLLVHIPKVLNPNNKVLTHNTWDIHVQQKLADGSIGKGVYLHRTARQGITQVTHNDIAIPIYILDAFRDHVGTQSIILRINVRQHTKNNILVRDKSYIDLLYTHTDEKIIQHLLGRISADLTFWKASNLEQSAYVKMMFDTPNLFSAQTMWQLIEGLGYYHTITLLCQRLSTTVLTDWFGSNLAFPKPYIFAKQTVFPVVYHNGQKVPWDKVVVKSDTHNLLTVGLTDDYYRQVGDSLSVEMFLDGPRGTYRVTPTEDHTVFSIPFTDFVIYEEITLEFERVHGVDRTADLTFVEIVNSFGNLLVDETADGIQLTFGPMMHGRTFCIQNRTACRPISVNIDSLLKDAAPIAIELKSYVVGELINRPIFKIPHMAVYLNNRYLVWNVDYTVQTFHDRENRFAFHQVIIQNAQYLQPENNIVEILVSNTDIEADSHGYVVSDGARDDKELTLYFDNITTLHVDGILEPRALNYGDHLALPEGKHRTGAVFEARTCIPKSVKDFLSAYHTNDDYARLVILNKYFYGLPKLYPDTVVVPYYHRIYSLYTALIVRDILNGTLKGVSYDPDIERMREQLTDYAQYKTMDLVHQEGALDLRFVDLYPHYRQLVVPDPKVYEAVQAFIHITMPEDPINSGE